MADFDRGQRPGLRSRGMAAASTEVAAATARRPQTSPWRGQRRRSAISSSTPEVAAPSWWKGDPEAQQRRRVARYKAYAVESKVRAALRKGIGWFKDRCYDLAHSR